MFLCICHNDALNVIVIVFCRIYGVLVNIIHEGILIGLRHRNILFTKHNTVTLDETDFRSVDNKRAMHPYKS